LRLFYCGYHNPRYPTVTEYTERALLRAGVELRVADFKAFRLPGRVHQWVPALAAWDRARLNRALLAQVARDRPEVFVSHWTLNIAPETWAAIRRRGIPTVCQFFDYPGDPGYIEAAERCGGHFDHFFCQSTDVLGRMRDAGHTHGSLLPVAADPEVHFPVPIDAGATERWGAEVAFVGSFYPERAELLEAFTGFRLGIWGPGWAERLPRGDPLRACLRGGSLRPEEWRQVYSAADIVISLTGSGGKRFPAEKVYQVSPRTFEVLACGGFYLVERKRDLEALFGDRTHLVMFGSTTQAVELARRYLHEPEERRRIARQGREHVLARHTYDHRAREMLAVVRRLLDASARPAGAAS